MPKSLSRTITEIKAFSFYAEIQDGRQKWREYEFWEKSPVDCRYHKGQKFRQNRSILHRFRDKCVFAFYAETQDGHQKWREDELWEKLPADSADTLWVKNFVAITVSCNVSEINLFLHFTQKFKMAAKNGGKTIFAKIRHYTLHISCGPKFLPKSLLSRTVSKINAFLQFYAEIQDGRLKWRENDFWEKSAVDSADLLGVKNFIKIARSDTVTETNAVLYFTHIFKMATKMAGKQFLGKIVRYPAGQKFR